MDKVALLQLVLSAHDQSARRPNISHEAVKFSAIGSGDYSKSLIAALSTIGGIHAPLKETWEFLEARNLETITDLFNSGRKVPGWGNAFHKGEPDPLWAEVEIGLAAMNPLLMEFVAEVTQALHSVDLFIYPNPSCYTAAAGMTLGGYNELTVGELFVRGRLAAWTEIFDEHVQCL